MKQISTGAGLVALSIGMVAAAFIATHRGSGEAFAQGTGTERRIVSQGVYTNYGGHWGYRIWSDNVTEVKFFGDTFDNWGRNDVVTRMVNPNPSPQGIWQVVDAGTAAFLRADVDQSNEVDSGDVSAVLLDFGNRNDETSLPPIECTINQMK